MATFENIGKLLEDKTKAFTKLIPAIDKQEKLVEGVGKQAKALAEQAKKNKKDKVAQTASDKAAKELQTETLKLEALKKSHTAAEQAIVALNQRYRDLKEFGESRQKFLAWWDKEEGKLMTAVDKVRDFAQEAEDASRAAEEAAGGGKVEVARKAAALADKAAKAARAEQIKAASMVAGYGTTWTAQRNLKSSHLLKEDVDTYADATKKVYEIFRVGQDLSTAASRRADEAERHGQSAASFASSGGDAQATYGQMVADTREAIEGTVEKVGRTTSQTWGKIISEKGVSFTKLLTQFVEKGEVMRAAAAKTIEQAGPLVGGYVTIVEKAQSSVESQQAKLLERLPAPMKTTFKSELAAINTLVLNLDRSVQTFKANHKVAMVEFNKLKAALER